MQLYYCYGCSFVVMPCVFFSLKIIIRIHLKPDRGHVTCPCVPVQYGHLHSGFSWRSPPLSLGWNSSPGYLGEKEGRREHDVRIMKILKMMTIAKVRSTLLS